ncbi:hypothetical protein FRC04_008161 [Tulasnella sp. 424]|nr:hypothetical protein FRC04_008161 [Tulasnella sp. 424]KAG8974444.1 hypothetical protein FRC05_007243 [Tulasnella sp. 425]
MAHPTNSAFVVQPPFDSDSPGDCFLQSPEGTKFKAYKAILYAASPIFRDMFSIPSRPSDASQPETEVPIIPVEEDAETLQTMLQMLYPIDLPTIKSVSLAGKLVRAFDKYFISMTKLQYYLRSILNLDQVLEKDPLACFAISWKLGLEPEAVKASRYTHDANLSDMAVAEAIVSGSGDLAALVALWDLRYRREEMSMDGGVGSH